MKETSTQTWYEVRNTRGHALRTYEYPLGMLLDGNREFDLERWSRAVRQLTSDSIYGKDAPYQIVKVTNTRTEEVLG